MPNAADEMTPMMRQYRRIKETCGDAILMFRLGDFYEMFEEDAKIASAILDLTLTKKHIGGGKTVPLAGIPYHALNNYLFRLTRAGHRVAICEQTEDPKHAKTIVRREVVRTVTPGTLVEAEGMEGSENNFLAAVYDGGALGFGLAWVDVSTGEFRATAIKPVLGGSSTESSELLSELAKTGPSEILAPEGVSSQVLEPILRRGNCILTRQPEAVFEAHEGDRADPGEAEFSTRETRLARCAAGAILAYLSETHRENKNPLLSLKLYRPARFLGLDTATERNLELVANQRDGGKRGTLFWVLDRTRTAMGARELRHWILRPLLDLEAIRNRQEAIATFLACPSAASALAEDLREVKDLERLLSRIAYRTAGPRDLRAMQISLAALPRVSQHLAEIRLASGSPLELHEPLDPIAELENHLSRALVEEPPLTARDGGIFAEGFNPELDELRGISRGGKDWILDLQTRERARTGIPSLKVSYNKVFGYYLEVTTAHQDKVPPDYIRKQTLVSAERYITPELKEYENKVLTAQERIVELEKELYSQLLERVGQDGERIQSVARRIAEVDCLLSLATVAAEMGYARPEVDGSECIEIEAGRHPMLDRSEAVERFVPNDSRLDMESEQVLLITGPNMGGKSTYIRQVALLVLMAQMGSYIPARRARIGLVDRIFSRVGASDNLFGGQSTFMVEMSETASILRNATPKSLIILDEIGRGTATYDGISLAWAIVEHLLEIGRRGVKTLFATHYHEMAELEDRHPRVKNHHALVAERDGKVTFLYQIAPGRSDHSYGIHVAELAGIPKTVTRRAARILDQLESGDFHRRSRADSGDGGIQLSLFTLVDEQLAEHLRKLAPEEMTPVEALRVLDELVRRARGEA
ncbi:MAG: DNA mismatch repair protein MutS [bacterium]|nr:DNA mismatch repair protein MutS [bacterium]